MLHTTDQERAGPGGGSTKRPGLTYDPEVSMNYDSKVDKYCNVVHRIVLYCTGGQVLCWGYRGGRGRGLRGHERELQAEVRSQ